ncbi:MAG: hypothetical protein LBF81_06265 [Prevotellaceae bacterium]|jgi:hypothetical protein|nr:hypothetical protein [Prevotellaceae bacterium]
MKTKHFFIAAMAIVASAAITGCKSTKSVQSGSNEVSVPLSGSEYRTDKDYFRASQSGKSPDLATAKKIALQNAKTELAGNIQSLMKAVTENYTNQRTVADQQEFENKFEENARAVVNQTLNDVKVIGEKVFKEKDGKYTYYIAIEMSKEPVVNNVADRISKDAKLQLDFDKHQFQKIFNEEMEKFEAQQQ